MAENEAVNPRGPCRPGDPDTEVVADVVAGVEAFEKLEVRYQGPLMTKAFESTNNRAEVQDAVQTTFAHAFQKIRQFKGQSTFATWLFTILRNELTHRWRKRVRVEDVEESLDATFEDQPVPIAVEQRTTEQEYEEHQEFIAVAKDIIYRLPETESRVCNLILLADLGEKDTSEVLSMQITAVRMAYMRGKVKLRELHQQREGHA